MISTIVPVYNGAAFLAGAIENILAQGIDPIEIIVVDDGSTDATAQVAAGFGAAIRYVHQDNAGPSAARNHGIRLAQGDLLAFLDVDDRWPAGALQILYDYAHFHPDVDIVQGTIREMEIEEITGEFRFSSPPYHYIGSALYRRRVFDRVGTFDRNLQDSEDVDWFIRAWEHGIPKAILPEVVLHYRNHSASLSAQRQGPVNYGLTRLIKLHLERMRTRLERPPQRPPGFPALTDYLGSPPAIN